MIVDVHTHGPTHRHTIPPEESVEAFGWRPGQPAIAMTTTWEDFDRGNVGVDVSIVCNIAVPDEHHFIPPWPYAEVNRMIEDFVATRPDRCLGFMSVRPGDPGALDEFERSRAAGLVGIKLGANYQVFDPLGREARDLYRHAERAGLPILFHQGTSPWAYAPNRYSHPLLMDEIAIDFPELRIVMAHVGHPFTRETLTVVRKHPHVYADVSMLYSRPWTCWEALTFATEWGVMDKLLFGSDFPHSTPAEAMELLRNVNSVVEGTGMPRVSPEDIEGIIHADALTALGLSLP